MATTSLSKALREFAADIDGIHRDLDRYDTATAAELARVLARIVEGKTIDKAFGAPGDFGYGTPIGDGIMAMLRDPGTPTVVSWHYSRDEFPDADITCLFALDTAETDEVFVGHYDGRAFRLEDPQAAARFARVNVYARAHAPAAPLKKGAVT